MNNTAANYYSVKHEAVSISKTGFIIRVSHEGNSIINSHRVQWTAVAD